MRRALGQPLTVSTNLWEKMILKNISNFASVDRKKFNHIFNKDLRSVSKKKKRLIDQFLQSLDQ